MHAALSKFLLQYVKKMAGKYLILISMNRATTLVNMILSFTLLDDCSIWLKQEGANVIQLSLHIFLAIYHTNNCIQKYNVIVFWLHQHLETYKYPFYFFHCPTYDLNVKYSIQKSFCILIDEKIFVTKKCIWR